MDKRFQVFISSTYTDLKQERQQVIQTLLEMDCIPTGMELFPAADEEQFEFIKKVIDDCDYYILIIGGRYGSTTAEGISFTEMEFDYAVQCGLHIIALVHGDPGLIPSDKTELVGETRDKLDAFRDKVCADRMVKKWTSADELPGAVALSLNKAIRTHPAVGWVRADTVSNQELLEQVNQLQMHNMDLRVQVESLHKTYSTEIDDLAEGSETIELSGTYSLRGHSGTTYKWEEKFTWDMILGFIGPHLMMNYSEKAANAKLARAVLKNKNKNYDLISYDVNDEIFQTIKIQLLALKYIEVNPFPTTAKTLDLFWILTEKGKSQLLKVKSIKSSTDS